MKETRKKALITLAVVAVIAVVCVLMSLRPVENFQEKYAGVNLEQDIAGVERDGTYAKYLSAHADATKPQTEVDIDLFAYDVEEGEASVVTDFYGVDKALSTESDSKVTFTVDIPESGFYNIYLEYLLPQSRGVAAERCVYINGEVPFEDARNLTFTRIWKDGGPVKIDNQGNQIRPTQVEEYDWQDSYLKDDRGYVADPYMFYFEAGKNTISLGAENEPMVIKKMTVAPVQELDTYQEYIAKQPAVNSSATAKEYIQQIEGESSTFRSESSLYAKYDRSSPTTSPTSVTKTVLNYVGGEAWRSTGQWIEWEFEVPEDGYYNIMVKGRQNYSRGSVSNRAVYIDGEIPFEELKEVSFGYSNDWENKTLADAEGTPYNFYLTKGKHTIRLEAVLGGLGPILLDLEDSTYRLNQMYRKILVYTGANPDQYRDYYINRVYPEIMDAMDLEAKRLYKLIDDTVAYSGQKADNIASAQTVAQQLERFCEKPNKITLEFVNFKDNITALGTAALNMSDTKLDIDFITVSGTDAKVKVKNSNFLTQTWHELKSFGASFIVDYNAVGNVYDENAEDIVKVWITTGRDQGTILKSMIDESFTPNTGIKVNLEIVDPGALLNAVLAGRGPNVVLSVGADQPVNFALRGASEDITQLEGWEEVLSHYTESSYEQYRLDGAIYGIPETQTFNVMFYRKDVLEELGLGIPKTWDELIEMLPTIQGKNLSVGIPSAAGSSTNASGGAPASGDLGMYFALLYQNGGDMYNERGTKTTVDDEAGMKAFEDYVRYFNDYGLPQVYDFASRFRSGEMPIGIQPYSMYNTLMVSAPEIRGLWDFTVLPGTVRVDENGNEYINNDSFIVGGATMMIATEDESIKQKSWEFMKWWAKADTQVRFGREIEALLGSSARYATANRDAFVQLSWSAENLAVLNEQWDNTFGIREVPGGYFTGRHISNAIRMVIFNKDDPRETIIDYSVKIDEEIVKKRKEFNLPLE